MTESQDPERLREQIAGTREELGDTVEALAAKTDVKTQAKRKVEETKSSVARRRVPLAAAGVALIAGLVAWRLLRR